MERVQVKNVHDGEVHTSSYSATTVLQQCYNSATTVLQCYNYTPMQTANSSHLLHFVPVLHRSTPLPKGESSVLVDNVGKPPVGLVQAFCKDTTTGTVEERALPHVPELPR
jgi:hypothetical protein